MDNRNLSATEEWKAREWRIKKTGSASSKVLFERFRQEIEQKEREQKKDGTTESV